MIILMQLSYSKSYMFDMSYYPFNFSMLFCLLFYLVPCKLKAIEPKYLEEKDMDMKLERGQ